MSQNWSLCAIHNLKYPSGAGCPECKKYQTELNEGYQPEKSNLNPNNPPKGGTGIKNYNYTCYKNMTICPKCGKPYIYVGDVLDWEYPPYCTCPYASDIIKKYEITGESKIPKLTVLLGTELSHELKNKIYALAYSIPKAHPDKKVEELYKEIIEELENEQK